MSKFRITTPVPGFTGVSAGVNFTNGVAEIEAPPELQPAPDGKELGRQERAERARVAQDERYRKVAYFRSQGYGVEPLDEAEADAKTQDEGELFAPSEHSVPEVLAYLEEADEDETRRVLDAEAAGKARTTILQKGPAQ